MNSASLLEHSRIIRYAVSFPTEHFISNEERHWVSERNRFGYQIEGRKNTVYPNLRIFDDVLIMMTFFEAAQNNNYELQKKYRNVKTVNSFKQKNFHQS